MKNTMALQSDYSCYPGQYYPGQYYNQKPRYPQSENSRDDIASCISTILVFFIVTLISSFALVLLTIIFLK